MVSLEAVACCSTLGNKEGGTLGSAYKEGQGARRHTFSQGAHCMNKQVALCEQRVSNGISSSEQGNRARAGARGQHNKPE